MKSELIILLLIFSMIAPVISPVNTQIPDTDEFNFTLQLITNDRPNRIKQANLIKTYAAPLGIDIQVSVVPLFNLANTAFGLPGSDPWDLIFVGFLLPRTQYPEPQLLSFGDIPDDFNEKLRKEAIDRGDEPTDINDYLDLLNANLYEWNITKKLELIAKIEDKRSNEIFLANPLRELGVYNLVRQSILGYDAQLGILSSLALGMKKDNTALNLDELVVQYNPDIMDRFKNYFNDPPDRFDEFFKPLSTLISLDNDFVPHPDIASQFTISDWTQNDTSLIPNGNFTFVINDDAYWFSVEELPDTLSNTSNRQKISPYDFGLAFDWLKLTRNCGYNEICNTGGDLTETFASDRYVGYTINQATNSISFFIANSSIADIQLFSLLFPLPRHILNGTVHFIEDSNVNGTIFELWNDYDGIRWQGTVEGRYFMRYLSNGPFVTIQSNATTREMVLRDDYWYPNEWDAPDGDFLPHIPGNEDAFFFTYNSTLDFPKQKPTKLYFDKLILEYGRSIDEGDVSGKDIFGFDKQKTPGDLEKSGEWNIQEIKQSLFNLLFYNLNNPHLQDLNVRKALSFAINRAAINLQLDGDDAPATFVFHSDYARTYPLQFPLSYNCEIGRDLMIVSGYTPGEACVFDPAPEPVRTERKIITEQAVFPMFFTMIALLTVVMGRPRKKFRI